MKMNGRNNMRGINTAEGSGNGKRRCKNEERIREKERGNAILIYWAKYMDISEVLSFDRGQ
jgi:hypothetical protein